MNINAEIHPDTLKVFRDDIFRERYKNIKTDFINWIRITNGDNAYYTNKKTRVYHFGRNYLSKLFPVNWSYDDKNTTGVLKFVCGNPANVTNDNFQI